MDKELLRIEAEAGRLAQRIARTASDEAATTLKARLTELDRERLVMTEKTTGAARPAGTVEELFELAQGCRANL